MDSQDILICLELGYCINTCSKFETLLKWLNAMHSCYSTALQLSTNYGVHFVQFNLRYSSTNIHIILLILTFM